MIAKLLIVVFYLLAPAGVLWACRRVKFLDKVGPVLTLYILGVVVANLHIVPESCYGIQKTLQDVMIPLAISIVNSLSIKSIDSFNIVLNILLSIRNLLL